MADKIAPAAWHEEPDPEGSAKPEPIEADKVRSRRDNARWSAAIGFLLLFAARFSVTFAAGGVLMIAYGLTASLWWSRKLRNLEGDPWAYDPELDGPRDPEWRKP